MNRIATPAAILLLLTLLLAGTGCAPVGAVTAVDTPEVEEARQRIEALRSADTLTDAERLELAELVAEDASRRADAARQQATTAHRIASTVMVMVIAMTAVSGIVYASSSR